MRHDGDPVVREWLDRQVAETLYLTTTSLSELLLGIENLPNGRRKSGLSDALNDLLARLFGSRILVFDREAAIAYAPLIARARANGRAVSVADGQIAAIAAVRGFTVATRDTSPFAAMGIALINPWKP